MRFTLSWSSLSKVPKWHYINFQLCRFFSPEAFVLSFSFRAYTIIILLIPLSESLFITQPVFVIQSHGQPASALVTCFSCLCHLRQAIFRGNLSISTCRKVLSFIGKTLFSCRMLFQIENQQNEIAGRELRTKVPSSDRQLTNSLKLFQTCFLALSNNTKCVHCRHMHSIFRQVFLAPFVDFRFSLSLVAYLTFTFVPSEVPSEVFVFTLLTFEYLVRRQSGGLKEPWNGVPSASWSHPSTKATKVCVMYVLFLWSCFPAHEFIFTAKTQTGRPFSPSCPGKFPLEWLFGFVP